MAFTPHSRNCSDFFPKDTLQGWKLEHNPAHLALYAMLSYTTYIFLVGQHPGTKSPAALRRLRRCAGYVLYSILAPSAQHNAYKKRERCQRSTKDRSTAKVHDLSCKVAPRDSSFTATKDSCNQTQADPPTRSPNRMLHRKTAFTGVFFVHARHLATDPFSKHNPTQRSSSNRTQQTKNKKLRTAGFKYPCGRNL